MGGADQIYGPARTPARTGIQVTETGGLGCCTAP